MLVKMIFNRVTHLSLRFDLGNPRDLVTLKMILKPEI